MISSIRMTLQKIGIIAQILKSPNSAFREISENSGHYFVFSVIIFAISYGLWLYPLYTRQVAATIGEIRYEWSAAIYAIETVQIVASPLLGFAVIFYVGKRFGGTLSFKKIFSALSHCLIPMIIGSAIVILGTGIYESIFVDGNHSSEYDKLASYALVFVLRHDMVFGLIGLSFIVWSVILAIKAVKIVNNFETKRSLGIIMLSGAAMYLFMMLCAILIGLISVFM